MIPLLPKWYLNHNRPTFYDSDAGTMLELADSMHSKMNEVIDDYNKFTDETNELVSSKLAEYEQDLETSKTAMRQEFQDFIDVVDMRFSGLEEALNLAKEING